MPFDFVKFAFSAGELSPELHGRGDLEGFRAGFRDGSNVVVDWRGGVRDRPGTRMAEPLFLDSSIAERARLSTFSFNTDPEDNYLLIWRNRSLMIVQDGGYLAKATPRQNGSAMTFPVGTIVLVHGADVDGDIGPYLFTGRVRSASTVDVPWKDDTFTLTTERVIAAYRNNDSPYVSADLRSLSFAQFRDELLITHNSYPPYLLRRTLDEEGFPVFTFEQIAFLDARSVQNKRAAIADRAVEFDSREGGFQWTVTVIDEEGKEYPVDNLDAVTTSNVDIGKKVLNLHWTADPIAARYRIYASAFKASFDELTSGGPTNTVNPDGTEKSASPTFPDIPVYMGKAEELFTETLPPATGGDGALIYAANINRNIFMFDPMTRMISGIPLDEGDITFTYTVTDEAGSTDEIQVTIMVAEADPHTPSDDPVVRPGITSVSTNVYGSGVTIVYSNILNKDNLPDITDFTIKQNGVAVQLGNHYFIPTAGDRPGRSNVIYIELGPPVDGGVSSARIILPGTIVTLSYALNADVTKRIQGLSQRVGEALAVTDHPVSNLAGRGSTTILYFSVANDAYAIVLANKLYIQYTNRLNGEIVPDVAAFTVTRTVTDGQGVETEETITVSSVAIDYVTVILTTNRTFTGTDIVHVSYNRDLTTDKIQNAAGRISQSFIPLLVTMSPTRQADYGGVLANPVTSVDAPTWFKFDVVVDPLDALIAGQELLIFAQHSRTGYPEIPDLSRPTSPFSGLAFNEVLDNWRNVSGATEENPVATPGVNKYPIDPATGIVTLQFYTGDRNNYWNIWGSVDTKTGFLSRYFLIDQIRGGGFGVRT